MLSKYHAFFPEKNSLGPQNNRPAVQTNSNSRKGQRGGWLATSTKTTTGSPGKDSPGWVCSTTKDRPDAETQDDVTSTRKTHKTGWTISSTKGGA